MQDTAIFSKTLPSLLKFSCFNHFEEFNNNHDYPLNNKIKSPILLEQQPLETISVGLSLPKKTFVAYRVREIQE